MSEFDKLPKEIIDHIVKTAAREYEYYRDESVHVTELVSCLRKAYFRRKLKHLPERTAGDLWYFYRGLIFDELWTGLFPRNQVRVTHRIFGGPTIVGRIDFIAYEPDPIIYELKTISSLRGLDEPHESHVKQVKFYAWCENIPQARIIYVSLEGVKVFDIDCSDSDKVVEEMQMKAMVLYECLKSGEIPPKTNSTWECKNCMFKEMCEKHI